MSKRREKRSLVSCQRGAIYIEFLIVIPVILLLWIVSDFVARGNSVDNEAVNEARHCAWRFAANRCEGGAGCTVGGAGEPSDADLEAASGNALARLRGLSPSLSDEWRAAPSGGIFNALATRSLARPLSWGTIQVEARQTWLCQTAEANWDQGRVFEETCADNGVGCGDLGAP